MRRGASVRRVDETSEDKDAEDRRSKGGAFSTGGEEGLHQRTRANAVQAVGARGPLVTDRGQNASSRRRGHRCVASTRRRRTRTRRKEEAKANPSPREGRKDCTSRRGHARANAVQADAAQGPLAAEKIDNMANSALALAFLLTP